MATDFVASTPTRSRSPASIHTPPTPRLGGFGDDWEPYTPAPRKSARLSTRASSNRTPSPHASGRTSRPAQPHARSSAKNASSEPAHQSADKMASPPATLSPQKKRQPATSRSVSGPLTMESIRNAAAALGQPQHKMNTSAPRAAQAGLALPTPAKTPARKHSDQPEKDVNAVARNLFGRQQSPKKSRAKRHNGISMDSFEVEEEPIQIYTDSQDRLPEVDDSNQNPFYGDAGIAASAAPVRRSSRNKKSAVAEKETVQENLKREDGMLYVFRGKKVFRKFSDIESASRFTVQPRLLFPSAKGSNENELLPTDEEAETDIDEQHAQKQAAKNDEQVETPAEAIEEKADTPKAPRFAPASPPSTSRATRSKKLVADEPTPIKIKGKRGGPRSPFDGWRRTKTNPGSSAHGHKRAGEELASSVATKRPKTQTQN